MPESQDLLAKQLTEREAIFRLIINGVKDYAIFMLNPDGYVMSWNEGAERIKGYRADEIIGRHFSDFYTEPDRISKHPDRELQIARKDGRYEEEGIRVRKDGTTFWANVVITAIYDDDRNLVGFAKVTRDLTERRRMEQQREADAYLLAQTNEKLKQALEVKSRFLSTISHEVRTPMTGVIGLTEILSMKDLGSENNAAVAAIFESSKRLLNLLNNILETAKLESGKVVLEHRNFPVRSVIGDTRQLIAREAASKGLRITGTCDDKIPEVVCGDELRVRQVLLNLAFNAVKFTGVGSVDLSAELKSENDEEVVVRFSVIDTGVGIPKDAQEQIFQPFHQATPATARVQGGTGLGLSICRELVDLMKGDLGVISMPGQGSTFWFEVPFIREKCEP